MEDIRHYLTSSTSDSRSSQTHVEVSVSEVNGDIRGVRGLSSDASSSSSQTPGSETSYLTDSAATASNSRSSQVHVPPDLLIPTNDIEKKEILLRGPNQPRNCTFPKKKLIQQWEFII